MVVGLERDQQAEGAKADCTVLRVLKNRYAGLTGIAGVLKYDHDTGRLNSGDFERYFPKEEKDDGQHRDY